MEPPSLIAIENSANCNLRCEACPTVHAPFYPRRFMEMDIFDRISDHISSVIFPKCALVGWGEPFLDPTYFEKLAKLKKSGYLVGSTTNLSLLNVHLISRIIEGGLDQLQISLDIHHIRAIKNSLSEIVRVMTMLSESVVRHSSPLKIGVNIIIFKTHINMIHGIFDILKDFPLASIGVAPLIMIPTEKFHEELVDRDEFIRLKSELMQKYQMLPISFQYLEDNIFGNCRSDIFRNVYVNYDGYVSPCCVLAMRFPNTTFEGKSEMTKVIRFGRLADSDFLDIWNDPEYIAFRQTFEKGGVPRICECCNAWRILG